MAHLSRYVPKHPEKYVGDPTNIICRSSWERRFAWRMDHTPAIVRWSSEEIVVPYVSPVDLRKHRYFVDFYLEVTTKDGVKKFLIEVKPKAQTKEPKRRKKTKRFISEVMTYSVNQAKWAAATKFAFVRGYNFLVITEDHLFGTVGRSRLDQLLFGH